LQFVLLVTQPDWPDYISNIAVARVCQHQERLWHKHAIATEPNGKQ